MRQNKSSTIITFVVQFRQTIWYNLGGTQVFVTFTDARLSIEPKMFDYLPEKYIYFSSINLPFSKKVYINYTDDFKSTLKDIHQFMPVH